MDGTTFEYSLHRAAAIGDDNGVRFALRSGADINALDASGKTALMCAIAGEDWQSLDPSDASFITPERLATIRSLINHPKISLFTLNAPHDSMNGVVPLGMAAWLNLPRVVRLLLEESADAVAVDGMDSHGATALMYAARDGNLEVVQVLLSHGARPDFRDSNYRTSVQFALPHPQILWLCETVLRRHRWRESRSADRPQLAISEQILQLSSYSLPSSDDLEPPQLSIFSKEATSRLLDTLVSSIRTGDLAFLHSLLFSPALPASSPPGLYPMSVPILVNFPDAKGWGLIHHAVSVKYPSVDVLDSLYCAGADMSLFTSREQWTPLHILAQSASVSPGHHDQALSLYQVVVHLIRDLRAPLSARDKNDETCIHIAARNGQSLELLTYLLESDKTGTVRQLKNSRGLTAMQVAKPEFLSAFAADASSLQFIAPFSLPTNNSLSSLISLSDRSENRLSQDDSSSICSPANLDVALTSQLLIANLRLSSPCGRHVNDAVHLRQLENVLADSRQQRQSLAQCFRDRINEAQKELEELRQNTDRIESLRATVFHAARGKIAARGIRAAPPKGYHRDSEDSQNTAVSKESYDFPPPILPFADSASHLKPGLRGFTKRGTVTERSSATTLSAFLRQQAGSPIGGDLATYRDIVGDLLEVKEEGKSRRDSRFLARISTPDLRRAKPDSPSKQAQKKKKQEEKELDSDKKPASGTTRFKAWLKRIVVPLYNEEPSKPDLSPQSELHTYQQDESPTHYLESPNTWTAPHEFQNSDVPIDDALRTAEVVLDFAERDLRTIQASFDSAQKFIDLANHSITKVERATKQALKKRQAMLSKLRASEPGSQWHDGDLLNLEECSPGMLGYSNAVSLRPSIASISSIQSSHSSIASAAPTVTEHDDEDTRVIRRLLLRKIEAQTSGAWEEIENAVAWLRVVKEVVRGVKRRAYL